MNLNVKLAHVLESSGSQCFSSIEQIPSFKKDLFNSGSRLDGLKGLCSPNNDEAKSAPKAYALSLEPYLQCLLRAPQGGVYIFNVDVVVKQVNKNVAWDFSQATLNEVSRGPFYGLPSLKGDFDNLYAIIL